eukprot:8303980-Pyramimonas_sp.AAC.1
MAQDSLQEASIKFAINSGWAGGDTFLVRGSKAKVRERAQRLGCGAEQICEHSRHYRQSVRTCKTRSQLRMHRTK